MKIALTVFAVIFFTTPLLRAQTFAIPLGSRSVSFHRIDSQVSGDGPLLISLHSNEATSTRAARSLLVNYAGKLIAIDGGGQRRIPLKQGSNRVTIDPNRVFSLAGVKRDMDRFSIYSAAEAGQCAAFGEQIIKTCNISKERPVIALHNNTNGGYSIDSYLPGGSEAAAAAKVSRAPADPDNFFLVTHPKLFDDLVKAGFNVVLQDNSKAPDDGSLSVYCGRRGIVYVNVEAQHGADEEQKRMLEALLKLLGTR
ncbi:MAG: hypothetical protein P1U68_03700 [Verrucomicrobiales bacterium]|nr:hypothetical protein [Verrucomicrobiales bacterium]